MYDPYGNIKQENNNIHLYDIFAKYIKPINGHSFMNNLTWDSYILYNYTKNHKNCIYLGKLFIKYNMINKQFEPFHITQEYLLYIYKLICKSNTSINKLLFNLEIEIMGYNHTNIIVIDISTKNINIFEPYGYNLEKIKLINISNNDKIFALKKMFKLFKNFNFINISLKYKIQGPQFLQKTKIINDFNCLKLYDIFICDEFEDMIFFYHSQNEEFINAITYPKKNPKIYKIHKNNKLYFVDGFDIHEGICDIYCLYFSLLLLTNNKSEKEIYKYISKVSKYNTIYNIIEWIIQWYSFQISNINNSKFKLLIFNKKNNLNYLLQNCKNYNRLKKCDKIISNIISNKECNNVDFNILFQWIKQLLVKKYGLSIENVNQILHYNNIKNIKCYIYLSIKNIYDLYNNNM